MGVAAGLATFPKLGLNGVLGGVKTNVPGDGEEGAVKAAGEAAGLAVPEAGLAGTAGEALATGLEAGVAAGVGGGLMGA